MKKLLCVCAALYINVCAIFAHPHVFIDACFDIEMRDTKCAGIWVHWTFDKIFSADIFAQFDTDKDGIFNEAETKAVEKNAFSNLRKYGYFTFLRKGDTRTSPASVSNFSVAKNGAQVTYTFYIDLSGQGFSDDFSIATFDTTFFVASRYTENPASFIWNGPESKALVSREINKKHPVYYNPFGGAGDMRVYQKWQKGLETAYPEEIRIRFE